ncbi:type II toxin-antitoxin system HicB family antitoxin [Promicromonospora sp. CA-289599]|uniref:type II toxin-antitoxin system HicB family antitoxin n=1 Tax=Promicromonospora sp. CA-289599 TaxID=3240014 RepID=UPI003D92690A
MTADHYTYRVQFSAADDEYVATVAEFASLSWLDSSPAGALLGLMQVVTDVVEDLRTSGEPVPEPLADREYSGKFMVRIPPEAHRRLAIEAAEQHVSLNRLIADRLAVA